MSLARYAKYNVERVSAKDDEAWLILAIINVLEFPPNESLNINVSFESL